LLPGPGFSFAEWDNGDLLLARSNSVVRKFDGAKFVEVPELRNLARVKAAYLMRDTTGTLYSLGGSSVTWFDGTNWLDVPAPDGSKEMSAQAMTTATAGGAWVTANKQIARLKKGTWVESLGGIPWPRQRIRAFTMLEDSTGTL